MTTVFCVSVFAAEESEPEGEAIPLLVIMANFDANGNGVDDFDPADPTKLYRNKEDDYFGEEWAVNSADAYYSSFFDIKYSVSNFFREMTMGKLYLVPLKLDVPTETNKKDGCIDVVVNQVHPSADTDKFGSSIDHNAFSEQTISKCIKATDPYIDYDKLDKDGDGIIGQHELLVVLMNPGASQETNGSKAKDPNYPKGYYAVWSTSQGISVKLDNVTFKSVNGKGNVTNMGEFTTKGNLQAVGTACHELAHNLGAEDIYARKVGASGNAKTPWPFVERFSLQCSGNYCGNGKTPSYLDPYQRIYLGWADCETVGEGEYTLYSTCTGKYKVLRVNTPNPKEYFLIEIRLKEGFETNLCGYGQGGICVWHIDDSVNDRYFKKATACSNYMFDGAYHDPGIVVLHTYNNTLRGIPYSQPTSDPFFYLPDEDASKTVKKYNSKFESMNYKSATNGTFGLNNYPTNWMGEQYFNLIIEPLTGPGQEMQIKISIEQKGDVAPDMKLNPLTVNGNTITVSGSLDKSTSALEVTEYGYEISTSLDFEENYQKIAITDDNTTVTFKDLIENKQYRVRMYVETEYGKANSIPKMAKTAEAEKAVLSVYNGDNEVEIQEVKAGELFTEPAAGTREGYTFGGWYTSEACDTPFDFTQPAESGAQYIAFAKWDKIPEETTATDAPAKSGGCGSVISCSGIVIAVGAMISAGIIIKRKDEE